MKSVLWIFYNIIFIPGFYFILRIAALFIGKIKKGYIGRKRLFENIILRFNEIDKSKKLVWFHSSSLGEFEQAKPIIERLKQEYNINILVTFFSPSGFENSKKYSYADIVSYIPFDFPSNAERFIKFTNPDIAVVMRYDIWPNHIYELYKNNIPILLVDATMRQNSKRKTFLLKGFHKHLFGMMKHILTVSESDVKNFKYFDLEKVNIKKVGDTRFDRVYERSLAASKQNLIKEEIIKNKKIFVAGSTWEQDEDVIIPAFIKLTKYEPDSLLIIAPHEPTIIHLENLENAFEGELKTIRFSHLNNYGNEKVIIIDSIGILLTLYYYADVTFVGGSFKHSIHNVLEAAVYGVPVMFGPKIETSQEANELVKKGGGVLIKNKKDAYKNLRKLFSDNSLRKKKGEISLNYVKENLGATDSIIKILKNYL